MADFQTAISWLKEGKKVRRKSFGDIERYCYISMANTEKIADSHYSIFDLNFDDYESTDWEIYCNGHIWLCTPSGSRNCFKEDCEHPKHCSNCGVKKLEETLSDYENSLGPLLVKNYILTEDVKEKIQNARKRLKESFSEKYEEIRFENGGFSTHILSELTDNIFEKEFGVDLC